MTLRHSKITRPSGAPRRSRLARFKKLISIVLPSDARPRSNGLSADGNISLLSRISAGCYRTPMRKAY